MLYHKNRHIQFPLMTAVILSLVLSMYFPSAFAVVTTEATGSEEPYRVLDIGNSYTDDATDLLKGLVESCGIDMGKIRIYKFTRSSGSFKTWVDCYNGIDDQVYHFRRVLGAPIQTPQGDADPYDATLLREVLEQETTNNGREKVLAVTSTSCSPSSTSYSPRRQSDSNSSTVMPTIMKAISISPASLVGNG